MIVSTALTLFLVPAVYVLAERLRGGRPTPQPPVPTGGNGVHALGRYEPAAEPITTFERTLS
jgi:hypothetical protein